VFSAQVADRLPSCTRTGRAVEPDHVHLQRLQDGKDGGDVGTRSIRPETASVAWAWMGTWRPVLSKASRAAEDLRLDLQDVLASVSMMSRSAPTLEQPLGLFAEGRDQLRM